MSARNLELGLFVQQVALAHGGDVTAESAERRTVLTVTLPKRAVESTLKPV